MMNLHKLILNAMALRSLILLSSAALMVAQNTLLICDNTAVDTTNSKTFYTLRPGSQYCYRYFESKQTFSNARLSCDSDGATLLRIDSREENDYVNSTFSSTSGFWIGLNDIAREGVFVWINGDVVDSGDSFSSWVDNVANAHNREEYDCVKFTSQGWIVHDGYCDDAQLPYACRLLACNSTDGRTCDVLVPANSSIGPGIIAVIVIVPLVVIIIVSLLVGLLVFMWKFQNDIFNKYICCCIYGSSKAQMNSLKQEIQRLQTELSQQKLNTSGRFPQLSRQTTQVSLAPPQPAFNRSFSSNKIVPMSGPTLIQGRPSLVRNNSVMLKPALPPVTEEKKPVLTKSPSFIDKNLEKKNER